MTTPEEKALSWARYEADSVRMSFEQLLRTFNALSERYDEVADELEAAKDRLRGVSLLWAQATSQGRQFLADPASVPPMRELLDGFTHPDELPDEEPEAVSRMADRAEAAIAMGYEVGDADEDPTFTLTQIMHAFESRDCHDEMALDDLIYALRSDTCRWPEPAPPLHAYTGPDSPHCCQFFLQPDHPIHEVRS